MSINLNDTNICGYRPRDLSVQAKIDKDTFFAIQNMSKTYNVTYDYISSDAKISTLNLMDVGSMAFVESWQYSLINHQHSNYNHTSVSTNYNKDSDNVIKIGTISVGNTGSEGFKTNEYSVIDIYCPKIKYYIPKEPAYGTLRFMYSQENMPDIIDINSDDFDGWVYPNGTIYTIEDPKQFNKDENEFITNDGVNPFISGNKLIVPDLRNQFFKINPFINYKNLSNPSNRQCNFLSVQSQVALHDHDHLIKNIEIDFTPRVKSENHFDFKLASNCCNFDKNSVHYGRGDDGEWIEYKTKIKMGACTVQLSTERTIDKDEKDIDEIYSYPSHNSIPIIIYVGGRRKEYNKIYFRN